MLSINNRTTLSSTRALKTLLLSAALISVGAHSALAKTSDTPIHFAKGAISSVATGNIAPLTGTSETANVGVLHMPNGKYDGTKGGIIYQGCLPATGEYRLRIARNLMATHGETAGYKAEVMVLPKFASKSLCADK